MESRPERGRGEDVAPPAYGRGAVAAAADLGSNSVHLLVAEVHGSQLTTIVDESAFLGLGMRADEGALGPATRAVIAETLAGYAGRARMLGAGRIAFVGTDPFRRVGDADQAIAEIEARCGIRVHVATADEEGLLTLLGVTAGRPVVRDLVVVDIGGGSSELVDVGPGHPPIVAAIPIGSNRLTTRIVRHDPPTAGEIEALRAEAHRIVADAPEALPVDMVAVGGTVTNLLKLSPGGPTDPILTRARLADAFAVTAALTADEVMARHAVNRVRSRILAAGAAIVEAVLDRYGLDVLSVSRAGIREGIVFALVRAGDGWPDRLAELAVGERDRVPSEAGDAPAEIAPE